MIAVDRLVLVVSTSIFFLVIVLFVVGLNVIALSAAIVVVAATL
jgi:hypothetical protein